MCRGVFGILLEYSAEYKPYVKSLNMESRCILDALNPGTRVPVKGETFFVFERPNSSNRVELIKLERIPLLHVLVASTSRLFWSDFVLFCVNLETCRPSKELSVAIYSRIYSRK